MSRTVHKGRRNTKGNSRVNLSSDRLELIVTERQNWRKKELTKERRNKKQTRRERWKQVLGTPLVDLELIEFRVLNEGKFIHYPASINDIARVMHSLPMEMLDGIAAIELCLGAEYQEDALYVENSIYKPDPFTRRCGCEILPGVFSGKIEGNYARSPATIRLFAYVYDPLLRDLEMWELYLRQKMLMQFVWQVARHHYSTTKVARETGEDCETYADRMQNELVAQFVIPYLEKAYSEALGVLNSWMQHHLCLSTPLSQLATKPNPIELLFTNKRGLKILTSEAATDEEQIENCMYFAWALYNCQSYAAALEIVTLILSEHPNHVGALLLAAIIYLKQEKYETAQKLAERLISNSQTSAG